MFRKDRVAKADLEAVFQMVLRRYGEPRLEIFAGTVEQPRLYKSDAHSGKRPPVFWARQSGGRPQSH